MGIHGAQQGQDAGKEADSWARSSRPAEPVAAVCRTAGFSSCRARQPTQGDALDWQESREHSAGNVL